jgi:hypothetical protein
VVKLGLDIKAKIGMHLRLMYGEVVDQGVPDRFVVLPCYSVEKRRCVVTNTLAVGLFRCFKDPYRIALEILDQKFVMVSLTTRTRRSHVS